MFLEDCNPTLLCSTKAMQSTVDLSQTLGNARHTHRVPGSLITRSAGCSPLSTAPTCIHPSVSSRAKSAVRVEITTAILMHSAPDFSQCPPAPAHISTVRSIRHYSNAGGVCPAKAKLPSTGSIEDPSFQAPRTPSSAQPKARPSLHDAVDSRFPPA